MMFFQLNYITAKSVPDVECIESKDGSEERLVNSNDTYAALIVTAALHFTFRWTVSKVKHQHLLYMQFAVFHKSQETN